MSPIGEIEELRAALAAAVATLPTESGADVARFLLGQGVRGRHYDAVECPLAKYLAKVLGPDVRVFVGGASVTALRHGPDGPVSVVANATPAMRWFVDEFDHGQHSELLSVI